MLPFTTAYDSSDNQLVGNEASELIFGFGGADSLKGDNVGNDTLNGDAGDDTIDGGTGNDVLEGGKDNDLYQGGDGNDLLYDGNYHTQSGQDTLDGGAGNDTLKGMGENDLYLFEGGYGHDVIEDYDSYSNLSSG